MSTSKVSGYLSKYKGSQIDGAVTRVLNLDEEFALKADKSLEINGHKLTENFDLSASDVGALSDTISYGASLSWQDGVLYLIDQEGNILGSVQIDIPKVETYTHEQGVPSNTWIIQHNLNRYPSVTLVDSAGTMFTAVVQYNGPNQCVVTMNGATTGKAYLN